MTTLRRNKIVSAILLILTLLWTSFIFSMSLKTASESSEISGGLLKSILLFIKDILWFEIDFSVLHNLFRKLAHFTEFFILGILSVGFIKSIKTSLTYPLLYCLCVAAIDETLQYFTGAGRSAQLSDVLLDFSGSLTAVIIFCLIGFIINKIRIKN